MTGKDFLYFPFLGTLEFITTDILFAGLAIVLILIPLSDRRFSR
jgi:hypothetical protein